MDISGIGGIFQAGMGYYENQQNIQAQQNANLTNIEFQRQVNMNNRQWALQDWERNNAYNSPAQQMQRFKEAGLNPNLIYGQGNNGNATMIRGADSKAAHVDPVITKYPDLSGIFAGFANITKTLVETDNLKAQGDLIQKDILLKQIAGDQAKLNLKIGQSTFDQTVKGAEIENKLKLASTHEIEQRIAGEKINGGSPTVTTLLKLAQTDELRSKIENNKNEATIQQYEIKLNQMGFTKHDSVFWRLLLNWINKLD